MTEYPHIVKDGNSWIVEGTKVYVRRLWAWHRRGTACEILFKRYPQLGPAKVLTALAFAYDNQDEMAAELEREHETLPHEPKQRKLPL